MKIGVLAVQGAFIEHIAILRQLGVEALPIRLPAGFAGLDGLIIPGGESTSIGKLMQDYDLVSQIESRQRRLARIRHLRRHDSPRQPDFGFGYKTAGAYGYNGQA